MSLDKTCATCGSVIRRSFAKAKYCSHRCQSRRVSPNERRARTYKVDVEVINSMLEAANGVCDICNETLTRTYIDHCHTTGRIRGVLCPRCNTGLGMFKDSADYMHKAINYLRKSGEK